MEVASHVCRVQTKSANPTVQVCLTCCMQHGIQVARSAIQHIVVKARQGPFGPAGLAVLCSVATG